MLKKKDGPMAGRFLRFETKQLKDLKEYAKKIGSSEASIVRTALYFYFEKVIHHPPKLVTRKR